MYSYLIGDIMTPTWGGGLQAMLTESSVTPIDKKYTFGENWHTEVVFG